MKARLLREEDGRVLLLCGNGTIFEGTSTVLSNLLVNFKDADSFNGNYGNWRDEYPDMSLYPGETVCMVTDNLDLMIFSFEPFTHLIGVNDGKVNYISTAEYGEKHGKSEEIIKVYCRQGRIYGAYKETRNWRIPEDAPYPAPIQNRQVSSRKKN